MKAVTEQLSEHQLVTWVVQCVVSEQDAFWLHNAGEWKTWYEFPKWISNPTVILNEYENYIKHWPNRQFRLHKMTEITRFEAITLEEETPLDAEPLGEDVRSHAMLIMSPHPDGRECWYHARLRVYAFGDNLRCLRGDHFMLDGNKHQP